MATPPTLQDTTVPKYIPPPYLINSSTLTAEDFIRYFEDFYLSLEYISCAPTLVFDRLMANVIGSKASLFSRQPLVPEQGSDCEKHIAALEECQKENQILRSENLQLREKLAGTGTELSDMKIVAYRGPNIGVFHSPISSPGERSSKISFSRPYTAPPGVVVGLRGVTFDVEDSFNTHISSFATNIQKDGFEIHHDCSMNYDMYSVWLEVDPNDADIQFGTFSTLKNYLTDKKMSGISSHITFPRAYDAQPQVVVWLATFSADYRYSTDIQVYTANITTTGFTLLIDSDYRIAPTTVSWVACAVNKPNIYTGTFQATGSDSLGYTTFNNYFTTPPRVLFALKSLRTSEHSCPNVIVRPPIIEATGMTWDVNTLFSNTKLEYVEISFIAIA